MAQADESKVAALESIFGGQDITASVIRTVLSSNDNKFDEAVDSLLNMTTNNNDTKPQPPKPARVEEPEEALRGRREQEKLKTLENMFGGDLTQSVICTVLESNKGELVDAVDTLLNMTSKEINPNYADVNQRDIERARQEEELKNHEEFKRLQIALQEEEARAVKEEQQRRAEDLRKSKEAAAAEERKIKEAAAAEERKRKDLVMEQERRLKEYEAQKKAQAELASKEQARRQEAEKRMAEEARRQAESRREVELEEAQEKLRRAWEEKLALLNAEEEKVRKLQEAQQAEEEARRKELLAREQALAAQEQQIQIARQAEEARLAEIKAKFDAEEAAKARKRNLELKQREQEEQQHRAEAEARMFKLRLEEEERTRLRRAEEERIEQEYKQRLDEERLELQREKAKFEALRMAEEERRRREEEERVHKETQLRIKREEEELQKKIELEQQRRAEEEAIIRLLNEERKAKEEEERQELLRIEQAQEAARLLEEEQRNQALKEEAEKQQAAFEEERRKKSVFDQLAASAVFIPPKAEATADQITITAKAVGDTVVADWDLPEGNASATNWLGLYPIRALPNTNKYVQFVYTNGAHSGQHIFCKVTPGHYEVRFFATRLYQHTACSATVRVGPAPTLSAQLQGDQLLVYYTLDPMSATPTREWLGIYEKTQRRNKLYLSSSYGNAEGNVMIKAPRTPGVYEVRLFAAGSVYNEQAKCEFVVEDNDCINIDPSSVMAGTNVTVSWVMRTVEPSSGDWIGLYKADQANNSNYLSCTYTTGSSVGSVTIAAPKETGVYELRLFARAKGRYTTFRTSAPLTVV